MGRLFRGRILAQSYPGQKEVKVAADAIRLHDVAAVAAHIDVFDTHAERREEGGVSRANVKKEYQWDGDKRAEEGKRELVVCRGCKPCIFMDMN